MFVSQCSPYFSFSLSLFFYIEIIRTRKIPIDIAIIYIIYKWHDHIEACSILVVSKIRYFICSMVWEVSRQIRQYENVRMYIIHAEQWFNGKYPLHSNSITTFTKTMPFNGTQTQFVGVVPIKCQTLIDWTWINCTHISVICIYKTWEHYNYFANDSFFSGVIYTTLWQAQQRV